MFVSGMTQMCVVRTQAYPQICTGDDIYICIYMMYIHIYIHMICIPMHAYPKYVCFRHDSNVCVSNAGIHTYIHIYICVCVCVCVSNMFVSRMTQMCVFRTQAYLRYAQAMKDGKNCWYAHAYVCMCEYSYVCMCKCSFVHLIAGKKRECYI